ncbi:MAG: hypothetical protein MUP81_03390 [Dehalococcoidia bacterium]|nr:hypothetical protein [Dehalococcoidia bacterium]
MALTTEQENRLTALQPVEPTDRFQRLADLQPSREGIISTAYSFAKRVGEQLWNMGVAQPVHALAEDPEENRLMMTAHSAIPEVTKGQKLPSDTLNQVYDDIKEQLKLPPEQREVDVLKKYRQYKPGQPPPLAVEPTETGIPELDMLADTGAGITTFIGQLYFTGKALPPGTPKALVWETQNLITGGPPGKGAAMYSLYGGAGKIGERLAAKIPGKGIVSKVARGLVKPAPISLVFEEQARLAGATPTERAIQAGIPYGFAAAGVAGRALRRKPSTIAPEAITPTEPTVTMAKQPYEMTRGEFGEKFYLRGIWGRMKDSGGVERATTTLADFKDSMVGKESRQKGGEILLFKAEDIVDPTKPAWAKPTWGGSGDAKVFARTKGGVDPHKYLVQQALSEGKLVPPEVLAEYPDLAKLTLDKATAITIGELGPSGVPKKLTIAERQGAIADYLRQASTLRAVGNVEGAERASRQAEELYRETIPPASTEGTTPEVGAVAANIPPREPPSPPIDRLTPRPVPPAGKKAERKFITSVKEQFPEMETRIAGQYIPRSTDNLSIQAKNLIRDNVNVAENYARTKADDKAIAITCELIKHYNEQANLTTDAATKNTLYDKAADIANTNARQLTELGRSVQAASILGRLTPEGQLRFAQKIINDYNERLTKRPAGVLRLQKRVPNLTTEQSREILTRAKTIQSMPDGAAKAQSWWELQNYISDLVPVPLYRSIVNTWKAGLLTGIKTHGLNTFANTFHGATEIIKDIPAVAVDRVSSLFTGERKLAFTGRGLLGGTGEGFRKGWRYLTTGYDERNVAVKYDYRRGSFGTSRFARWVQAYDETVFELMGAEDQPFYYGAKARSLYSQAAAQAKNRGLVGTEKSTLINNLVQNPTDEMIKYATVDAEVAVFQNKTILGDVAKAFQKIPGGEFVVPFGRTPSAVAMQIVNYSPIGIPKTIIQNIGKGRFDQRLFSQGIGRGLTGTAVLAIGTALWKAGLITLDRPKSEKERELWTLEGRQANSIKIGNKWRTVQTFGPAGNLLVIGGHFQNALETSGSPTEAITMTLAGAGKSFSEQTFVRGVNQAAEALQDPARSFESFFSQFAGSTVPTIVADTARAMDSMDRRTIGPVQKVQGRIPVLRESLEPRVDVFGQDLPRYGGNVLEVMADPTRPVKIKQDVVVDELRRLWDVKIKVSPTLLGDKAGYEGLTPEQNTKLLHRAGQLTYHGLFSLINNPAYKKADDELKGKIIEKFVDESKNIARAEAVIDATNSLTDLNKLKEARKNGLLTVEVGDILGLSRETVIMLGK